MATKKETTQTTEASAPPSPAKKTTAEMKPRPRLGGGFASKRMVSDQSSTGFPGKGKPAE